MVDYEDKVYATDDVVPLSGGQRSNRVNHFGFCGRWAELLRQCILLVLVAAVWPWSCSVKFLLSAQEWLEDPVEHSHPAECEIVGLRLLTCDVKGKRTCAFPTRYHIGPCANALSRDKRSRVTVGRYPDGSFEAVHG